MESPHTSNTTPQIYTAGVAGAVPPLPVPENQQENVKNGRGGRGRGRARPNVSTPTSRGGGIRRKGRESVRVRACFNYGEPFKGLVQVRTKGEAVGKT